MLKHKKLCLYLVLACTSFGIIHATSTIGLFNIEPIKELIDKATNSVMQRSHDLTKAINESTYVALPTFAGLWFAWRGIDHYIDADLEEKNQEVSSLKGKAKRHFYKGSLNLALSVSCLLYALYQKRKINRIKVPTMR